MQTKNAARVLPRAGGGGDEGGFAGEDAGPTVGLGLGGAAEFGEEPLGGDGVRPGEGFGDFERHALIVARFCSWFVRRFVIYMLPVPTSEAAAALRWLRRGIAR